MVGAGGSQWGRGRCSVQLQGNHLLDVVVQGDLRPESRVPRVEEG